MIVRTCVNDYDGARDGFTQPIFYKRFNHFSFSIRQNALKNSGQL